jgi:UDP:flavonoid glycosyltransferase YjiC (YdhE family)
MLEKQGAGLSIHVSEVTGESFRAAIDRLLTEQVFKDRAVALRDEIFALPTPNQAVPRIEELVVKHRAR